MILLTLVLYIIVSQKSYAIIGAPNCPVMLLYCLVLHVIELYSVVLYGIAYYFIVFVRIVWYCMLFQCIAWYCIVLHGVVQFIAHRRTTASCI